MEGREGGREREKDRGSGRKGGGEGKSGVERERGLTTKVALFAGFKTRNFLSRFSQSVDM